MMARYYSAHATRSNFRLLKGTYGHIDTRAGLACESTSCRRARHSMESAGMRYMNRSVRTKLLVIGAMVGISIVAAGCRGGDGMTDAQLVRPDSAQQLAFGARLTLTDFGVARAMLVADSALIHDEGLRMDLRRVRLTFVDTAGDSIGTLHADRAMYDVSTSTLDATGGVLVSGPNGRVLRTSHLVYDPIADLLRSDSSYTFTQVSPTRESSGQGFESDPRLLQVGKPKPKQ